MNHLFARFINSRRYKYHFGRAETRLLRRSRRLGSWRSRCLARTALMGARDMNHWLFRNPGSLLIDRLALLPLGAGGSLTRLWVTLGLAAIRDDARCGPLDVEDVQAIDTLLTLHDAGGERPLSAAVAALPAGAFGRAACQAARLHLAIVLPPPLTGEDAMVFDILSGQMMDGVTARARRLLGEAEKGRDK